ncbi:hypothetical protein GCM10027047_01370 [Rhodococcus aerolatus]
MTEIAVREDTAPALPVPNLIQDSLADLEAAHRLATIMCNTSFVPKEFRGKPDEGAVAILMGARVGFDPTTALQSIYVISGKPALYAAAMVAIVLAAGHEVWVDEEGPEKVVVSGQRGGSDRVYTSTWTIERAKRAGFTSNANYQKQPESMLYARAASDVCRRIARDALMGMDHSVEELRLASTENGVPQVTTAKAERVRPRTIIEAAENVAPRAEAGAAESAPAAEPAPEPAPALTQGQGRKMHALFRAAGLDGDDRTGRLDVTSRIVGRPLASSSDLTRDEGALVIDTLEDLQNEGVLVESVTAMRGDGELPPEPGQEG